MAMLKLSPPWIEYYDEVQALFEKDKEVHVIYDDEEKKLSLYVDNAEKADALTQLLPTEKEFGNITMKINVIPANGLKASKATLLTKAFEGNGAVSYMKTVHGAFMDGYTYIVFVNEVVQYFNDAISDINGMRSTLYQDIANEIFPDHPEIFFCTDVASVKAESYGKPLGEWP